MIQLNDHIKITEFEEGVALFNSFTQDTHFVKKPNSLLFALLNNNPQSVKSVEVSLANNGITSDIFEQILEEAIASGILLETQPSAS